MLIKLQHVPCIVCFDKPIKKVIVIQVLMIFVTNR